MEQMRQLLIADHVIHVGGTVNPNYEISVDGDVDDVTGFDSSQSAGSYQVEGFDLGKQQFKALFLKRFHYARRNRKGIIAQIIVPAIFVAIALAFTLIVPDVADMPPLELQPWMYGSTNVFYSNDDVTSARNNELEASLLASPGLGNRCLRDYEPTNWDERLIQCPDISDDQMQWLMDDDVRGLSKFEDDYGNDDVCTCTGPGSRVLLAECVNGTNGSPTPKQTTWTSDVMYNMTGRNTSDWLVKTVDRFIQQRYGGLSFGEVYNPVISKTQLNDIIQVIENLFNVTYSGSLVDQYDVFVNQKNNKVWFDNNGYHSMPIWMNVLNNARLRSRLPPSADPNQFGIVAINHPLNLTEQNIDLAALTQSASNTLVSLSIIFALSFVPSSFVLFLIEERTSKAKHLQFISGVNPIIYWITNYLWDLINYSIPALIIVLIFFCFQTDAYVSSANLPCLITILILYGFSVIPMMYPASFYFQVPSTAYVVLTCVNIFIGVNTCIATTILELLNEPNLDLVNSYLKKVFLIFPQYCLGRGLIDMAINQAYADAYAQFGVDRFKDPFSFELVGRNLMSMSILGFVFFFFALLLQYNFFIGSRNFFEKNEEDTSLEDEDDDVVDEKRKVEKSVDGDEVLQIRKLTKIYKKRGSNQPLIAVKSMSLGVPAGECFGLLGVNGAGKTTTFQMLTGDTTPSSGDAIICGHSVRKDLEKVQQKTGYCPQFEALNSMLTGYEHLQLYARLRGVPECDIDRVAEWAISNFGLVHYASKPAGTYSGGNKRKLSAAIAFIGRPSIVFLDEPTAGMDPLSRRFLWSRITEAVKSGQCVVMTSHSMEECEVLCTRLAIMVNGQFRCIGTTQHLKNKFGKGYTFSLRAGGQQNEVSRIQKFVKDQFPGAVLKEVHCNMLVYQLKLMDIKLGELFEIVEENKKSLKIEDYSISQTTLDEVFVEFAKLQTDGSEEDQSEELLEDNLHYDPRNIALTKVSKSSNLKCGVM